MLNDECKLINTESHMQHAAKTLVSVSQRQGKGNQYFYHCVSATVPHIPMTACNSQLPLPQQETYRGAVTHKKERHLTLPDASIANLNALCYLLLATATGN